SHVRVDIGGVSCSVLSRVSAAGLDYSQRGNKFAHHIVLGPDELPVGGPAWLLAQPGFVETAWHGEPRFLATGRSPPRGDSKPAPCGTWQTQTGDAGWSGFVAEAFLNDPERIVCLLFRPGTNMLPLIQEAIALLPVERRWEVTFSTYFTGLPPACRCCW